MKERQFLLLQGCLLVTEDAPVVGRLRLTLNAVWASSTLNSNSMQFLHCIFDSPESVQILIMTSATTPTPFSRSNQLCDELDDYDPNAPTTVQLPGNPTISMNNVLGAAQFLENEFCSKDLERFAPHLWIMSTYSGANINALHRQRVKGREIIVTEEPRLHLVWIRNQIFIKPLPRYLLSHTFWDVFLGTKLGRRRERISRAARGFLRTYFYLIQHESDFVIAKQDQLRLIPSEIEWSRFCFLLSEIHHIQDADVSERYHYGELRLSRLNLYAPFFLRKFYFEQVYGQYGEHFARLYGPVLFIFAIVSTILNGMQVGLAVEQVSSKHWIALWSVSRWFSLMAIIVTALIAGCFVLLWIWLITDEWVFTIKRKMQRRRSKGGSPSI